MIADNLQQVHARVARACSEAGRDVRSVTLLNVSKTFGADAVREAVAAGEHRFGENYVAEGVEKIAALADLRPELEWHLIGPLQSNKTRVVAEQFDWGAFDRSAQDRATAGPNSARPGSRPLQVCLQVNISGEASKSGVLPADLPALAHAVAALPQLALRGLMAIPEPAAEPVAQRVPHRALRELLVQLKAQGLAGMDTLSMGMSADLEAAVAEGATIVRIGSAIFGGRPALSTR